MPPDQPRRIVGAALSGGVSKLATAIGATLAIPLVVADLSALQFGVYALLTSLVALLPFGDFGVGLSLVTKLASAKARGDTGDARRLVASAFAFVAFCGLGIFGAGVVLNGLGVLSSLLGISELRNSAIENSVLITVVTIGLYFPATVGSRILFGSGLQHVANWWQCGIPVLSLTAALGVHLSTPSLSHYVAATQVPPLAINTLLTIVVFVHYCPALRFRITDISRDKVRTLLPLGLVFAIQGATMVVGYQSDLLVLTHMVGAESVGQYSLALKLTTLITLVAATAITPLWPHFTEAQVRGDSDWTSRILRHSIIGCLTWVFFSGLAIIALGQLAIRWFTGGQIIVPSDVIFFLTLSNGLQALQVPMAVYLNALGVKTFQLSCSCAMALTNLPISIYLTSKFGLVGPAGGTSIAVFTTLLLPYWVYVRRRLKLRNPTSEISVQTKLLGRTL